MITTSDPFDPLFSARSRVDGIASQYSKAKKAQIAISALQEQWSDTVSSWERLLNKAVPGTKTRVRVGGEAKQAATCAILILLAAAGEKGLTSEQLHNLVGRRLGMKRSTNDALLSKLGADEILELGQATRPTAFHGPETIGIWRLGREVQKEALL